MEKIYKKIVKLIATQSVLVYDIKSQSVFKMSFFLKIKLLILSFFAEYNSIFESNSINVANYLLNLSTTNKSLFNESDLLYYTSFLMRPNYIVAGNTIYSKRINHVKNRSYIFLNQGGSTQNSIESSIHIDEQCYILQVEHGNLGHLFHDNFFHLYFLWKKNKRKVLVFIKTSERAATNIGTNDVVMMDFIKCAFGKDYILECDFNKTYTCPSLIVAPEGRDLRIYKNYIDICDELKNKCFNSFSPPIVEVRNKKYLYSRSELERKKLLDIDNDFLEDKKITLVNLTNLTFENQLRILASAKTFIYVVGAGVFNLLFLSKDVNVLEINPYMNNSWAQKFGMSDVCKFHVFVSSNLKYADSIVQDNPLLDSHIVFDDQLKEQIMRLL